MSDQRMKDFWDEKARENAMWYVSSYRDYGDEDPEEFFRWGRVLGERFLGESNVAFDGNETVLEIGCGLGRMSAYFAARFARVHALDVSAEMIQRAQDIHAGLTNLSFEVGNGHDLSAHADASVDFVFSYICLQHIPEREVALGYFREAARVLRPGGHLHMQIDTQRRRAGFGLKKALRRILPGGSAAAPSEGPRDLDHPAWVGCWLRLEDVRRVCSASNLKILRVDGAETQYCWVTARREA